jgi:threonine dehydrogenase-like Zn-dependent dehydrogenase
VGSGGTLGGYGAVTGPMANNGIIAAGSATPGFASSPTGTFTVIGDVLNQGAIQLASGMSIGNVLAVRGDYNGVGATMAINTFLGGDGSPSDKLVIDGGAATGNTSVRVANIGGPEALTTANGIQVVDAVNGATTAPGALPARFVHRVSRSMSIDSAALVEPTAVALNGIMRGAVSSGDYVAIFGDGPIGLLLLQVVRSFCPARVTVVGATELRLALAAELGADAVVDSRKEDIPARLREGGCGELPSVILEATGNSRAVATAIHSVAPGGRIVLQGLIGASSADGLDLDHLVVNDITVCGALGSPSIWPRAIELIESGSVDPSRIVTDHLPLSEFHEGIRRPTAREALKTILTPRA